MTDVAFDEGRLLNYSCPSDGWSLSHFPEFSVFETGWAFKTGSVMCGANHEGAIIESTNVGPPPKADRLWINMPR